MHGKTTIKIIITVFLFKSQSLWIYGLYPSVPEKFYYILLLLKASKTRSSTPTAYLQYPACSPLFVITKIYCSWITEFEMLPLHRTVGQVCFNCTCVVTLTMPTGSLTATICSQVVLLSACWFSVSQSLPPTQLFPKTYCTSFQSETCPMCLCMCMCVCVRACV
jgi:hypothetical protein